MMSGPQHLTPELLDRFAEASGRAGGPLPRVIRPGLSDAEIDEYLTPLGLTAPDELRTLWQWGVMPDEPSGGWDLQVHPLFQLLPPERAIAKTQLRRSNHQLRYPRHRREWLVIAVEQDPRHLLIDCSTATPISAVIYDEEEAFTAAKSLGDLFAYWLQQIEDGDSFHEGMRWQASEYAEYALPIEP